MSQINALSESLMTNAFDLIGGSTMAQQFLEHMDFYANNGTTTTTTHHNHHQHPEHQNSQTPSPNSSTTTTTATTNSGYRQQQQQLPNNLDFHQQTMEGFFPTTKQMMMFDNQQHRNSKSENNSSASSSPSSLNSNHLYNHFYKPLQQQYTEATTNQHQGGPSSPANMPRLYELYGQQSNPQQHQASMQHSLSNTSNHLNHHHNNNNNHHQLQQQQSLENNLYQTSQHLSNLNIQMDSQQQQQQQQNLAQTAVIGPTSSSTSGTSSATSVATMMGSSNNTTLVLGNHNSATNNNNANNHLNHNNNNNNNNNNNGPNMGNNMSGSSSSTATSVSTVTTLANPISPQQQQEQQSQSQQHQQYHHQQHQHQQQHHQQQHQHEGGSTSPYKSCLCFGDSTYHMKILVPAVASGAIIGKGGETIASLQKDTGARVKMSKSHDFYPGTTERVCLITGTVDGIMAVLDFVMDKIREKPDLTSKILDAESKQSQERDKQVKILVPNSTAGMIIGKGGAYIKQVKEESGSYVQISQKPKDISLQERCITIIGDKENNKNACKMILSKIVEDPSSGTCLNVSYADINGPVANFNPTGSPYATNQNAINSSTASLNSTLGTTIGGAGTAAGLLVNGTGINLSLNLSSPNPAPNLALATQLLEHIKVALRSSGYSETATTEVCAALGVLAKYGVLGMGVGLQHTNGAHTTLGSYLGVSALDQQTAAAATAATAGNVFGAVGQVNLEQYSAAVAAAAANRPTQQQLDAAAAQFDPFRHLNSNAGQAATPVSLNNNSFGLTAATGTVTTAPTLNAATGAHALSGISKSPTPGDLSAKDTKNVEIPEVIVGAILGPNGRCLVEIQHISGANVQISKKGIFAPGTRNRIVTITGQPSAIAKAQYLIEQKINEEETKRARQIPLATVVN
ncbi:RNA-binding protein Pasilla isoform X1 [Musca domestica]|uniref:RNA-binding protein Pasilla isoform X1 n=2 Tax=Musca domestica TaxID=7370 RepID=A0ABM3VIE3_MUSDO|nr:RNA-binding protein Pasilla isoform X1 [Musca domestica]XP_058985558.1 RNA-binding protein Pasilla isoform X1 [Musca domestica]XP_058985559.1 RNA-binding protein Pasilla isoform X1 [Musca domestica]XP_058985560.1 RNA-binding protein Pasilla isoform X1 [Musca domestica]XP_058985561.1 RNA-binding protein Pasilla isoform X1 [Musca domestica]XP_058985563.1 RNA-binding protein Pasilla isoform X1 [Musca domestica]